MPVRPPNFSPFPFAQLPRLTRAQAAIESAVARHLDARRGAPLAKLASSIGGPVRVLGSRLVGASFDPEAALCELRLGTRAVAIAASGGIRALAQRLLGGAPELAAPRPPTLAEHAVLAVLVATALDDAGIAGEVWPLSEQARAIHQRGLDDAARRARLAIDQRALIGRGGMADAAPPPLDDPDPRPPTVAGSRRRAHVPAAGAPATPAVKPSVSAFAAELHGIELAIDAAGTPLTIACWIPGELLLEPPPARAWPSWTFALPVVVARCLLPRDAVAALAVRDVVVVEPGLRLIAGDGAFELTAAPDAVEARVATGYVRAVAPSDEVGLPLTVQLGTVRLSLRRLAELAVGEVIGLARPLAGPYEIHAAGRLIGHGELVDLDGEIGVRIVSLTQE